jgi:putative transcriptional regulator
MNNTPQTAFHSVDEEWLASYCAGGLSSAKHLLISCQSTMKPELSSRLAAIDQVGGALLESAQGEALSQDFFERILEKMEAAPVSQGLESAGDPRPETTRRDAWIPSPLEDFLKQTGQELKWKKLGFGVERASLSNDDSEELYLLKAPPGLKVPRHTHEGEEWALIMQGGYKVGDESYGPGDLHREDESCTHRPIVDDDGEPCITLVALEGSLKFSNPIMRLLKPLIGI